MRILVADDEPEMTMVLEALLKREHYSVDVVCYLRRKLEAVGGNVRITARRGQGYLLEEV